MDTHSIAVDHKARMLVMGVLREGGVFSFIGNCMGNCMDDCMGTILFKVHHSPLFIGLV